MRWLICKKLKEVSEQIFTLMWCLECCFISMYFDVCKHYNQCDILFSVLQISSLVSAEGNS